MGNDRRGISCILLPASTMGVKGLQGWVYFFFRVRFFRFGCVHDTFLWNTMTVVGNIWPGRFKL